MVGKGLPSLLGFVGGLLVVLSGLAAFLTTLARSGGSFSVGVLLSALIGGLFAAILGVIVMFFARPRLLWWRGRLLFNGAILIVLGIVIAYVLPLGFLVLLGAVLTIVAGAVFAVESFMPGRSWFRQSWF